MRDQWDHEISEQEVAQRIREAAEEANRAEEARNLDTLSEQEGRLLSKRAMEAMGRKAWKRQFALSEMGFMAQVPDDAKEGDMIAVFAGAKVAYLLRSQGPDCIFKLVGEAYVHGMMDDKATRVVVTEGSSGLGWITIV
jgi:hypothetical protein